MRESAIEAHLVRRVRELGGIAYKWVSPGRTGVPDRIVVTPGAYAAFVELKAPGKKPTPIQLREQQRLIRFGMQVYVIDSVAGVDEFINRIIGDKNAKSTTPQIRRA